MCEDGLSGGGLTDVGWEVGDRVQVGLGHGVVLIRARLVGPLISVLNWHILATLKTVAVLCFVPTYALTIRYLFCLWLREDITMKKSKFEALMSIWICHHRR